jgi:hypothetical protein
MPKRKEIEYISSIESKIIKKCKNKKPFFYNNMLMSTEGLIEDIQYFQLIRDLDKDNNQYMLKTVIGSGVMVKRDFNSKTGYTNYNFTGFGGNLFGKWHKVVPGKEHKIPKNAILIRTNIAELGTIEVGKFLGVRSSFTDPFYWHNSDKNTVNLVIKNRLSIHGRSGYITSGDLEEDGLNIKLSDSTEETIMLGPAFEYGKIYYQVLE